MDSAVFQSRSSPALTARHSRRSFPNLTHLSLAPLSSKFPLSDDDGERSDTGAAADGAGASLSRSGSASRRPPNLQLNLSHTSYILGKSAPTTPSILESSSAHPLKHSRAHHRKQKSAHSHPTYIHDAALASTAPGPLTAGSKAYSVAGINPQHSASSIRSPGLTRSTTSGAAAHATATSADEWLHRAGVVISTQSLETKGQSWLVSRASSTSLVSDAVDLTGPSAGPAHHRPQYSGDTGDALLAALQQQHSAPASRFAYGSRFGSRPSSRPGSRAGSRPGSARGSRRGSTVASRAELAMTGMLPGAGPATTGGLRRSMESGGSARGDYFASAAIAGGSPGSATPGGPDFIDAVDAAEEDELDGADNEYVAARLAEDEIRALAAERGFGLGGLVDRLFGMSLFSVDGDSDDDDDENGPAAEGRRSVAEEEADEHRRREAERKRRQEILKLVAGPRVAVPPAPVQAEGEADADEAAAPGGGWKDAAWLLSVATKVIL